MEKEKANDDPFFDPRWDEMWDRAESVLLQQIPDVHDVEEESEEQPQQQKTLPTFESLKQKSIATAETREKLQQAFKKLPGSAYGYQTEKSRENKNQLPNFWMRKSDTTPMVDPQDSNGRNIHKAPCNAKFSSISTNQSLPAEGHTLNCEKTNAAKNLGNSKRVECEEDDVVEHKYIDYSLVSDEEVMHPGPLTSGVPIETILNRNLIEQGYPSEAVLSATDGHMMDALGSASHTHAVIPRVVETFPGKLHLILSKSEYRSIITWLPHGRSFIVRDPESLQEKVFPIFFKLTKYNSFSRQLSLWGFKRLTTGVDFGSYYHPLFLRGKPLLTTRMTLTLIKGIGTKRKSNPRAEPDLTALSRIRPLPDP
mmetsp:Transcript_7837/g.11576  ORF Transcript_7837/g.11576 Transcript_7837/m.11576 type:complete len:368 (+) Transcript_7837:455-1558(+)|eukprot:CAMPEP_0196822192 /NCGR_PEP_ID=MMETSP1362-20130617/82519_1 /TAXON_ID=163516 /ORGANISM="Leptocylindrus danicus, Strain CCMP1856" /LENGTH=367 /DNA_ID=CAMNT_0042201681 /DNA_START=446 /DNA_END=1549 /DNA_ORIENTATION=-